MKEDEMIEHDSTDCHDVACRPCLNESRLESVVRLESALLELETSPQGAAGMWVDLEIAVDALDIRNVLDLLRAAQ